MSFRRPKKPVRPRVVMLAGDSDEEDMDDTPAPPPIPVPPSNNGPSVTSILKTKVKEEKRPAVKMNFGDDEDSRGFSGGAKGSLLSFDDDLEGDDGEVFKIKKSSTSRRLMKQREREKKDSSKGVSSSLSKKLEESKSKFQNQVEGFTEQITIKTKHNEERSIKIKTENSSIKILNGREAEAVNMEYEDDDEEEEEIEDSRQIRFRRPGAGGGAAIHDAVRRALEQGQIPDANLIHEARKRKQLAREQGTTQDFVPVENTDRIKTEKGRLIREDDENDQSDEERLDFSSATNAAKIDRERIYEDFKAAQDEHTDDDSDGELHEWENQQIRKGVSQAKMNNVAKEMYQQTVIMDMDTKPGILRSFSEDSAANAYPTLPFYSSKGGEVTKPQTTSKGRTQVFMEQTQRIASLEEIVNGTKKISPELIMKQMADRLEQLKISRDRHAGEVSRLDADLKLSEKELEEANRSKSGLNSRFIMYQNLRGYVTDLVDCLRCKMPYIESLEKRMIELMRARRDRFTERRRQDVRDQMEEVSAAVSILGGNPSAVPPPANNPERTRRAAEREGRRTRRRRMREKEMKDGRILHKDGLSSDDEETDLEANSYKTYIENILREAEEVFADVHEDFGTIEGILSRFEEWKDSDFDAYKESYAYLCLPKCLAPLIRLHCIAWDPMKDGCDLMKFSWIKPLVAYGYKASENQETLKMDPDCRLIPSILEKILVPWITRIVESKWDPMSGSQTRELVNVLNRLIDESSISPNSKPMHNLFETVVLRFKEALDNDVYIPLYPKTATTSIFSVASVFSSRQFWSSVKLLDNMSKWQGLLSDRLLQTLALDALLTRYTLLGIRIAPDLTESCEKAKGVVNVLPRAWLSSRDGDGDVPNGLQQLSRCLCSVVQSADCTAPSNRIAIPDIANVLKTIGSHEEARIILRKYS